jgi:hypothetical protein
MKIWRLFAGFLLAICACLPADAQQTKSQLNAQNNSVIVPNGVGAITAANLHPILQNMINASCTIADPTNCPISALTGSTIAGGPIVGAPSGAGFVQIAAPIGSGTVDPGTANQFAFYPATAATVTGMAFTNPLLGPNVNNVIAAGADPTGSVDASTIFNNILTAIGPTGGTMFMPCGTYKIESVSVLIAASKDVSIIGGGQRCTILSVPAGDSGLSLVKVDSTATLHLRNFSVLANSANQGVGISLDVQATSGTSAIPNDISNVMVGGVGFPGQNANYFIRDIQVLDGVSSILFLNDTMPGNTALNGDGVVLQGNVSTGHSGIVYNFINTTIDFHGVGLVYGSQIQGVQISNGNFTGNDVGIQIASGATNLDELVISSSQFQSVNGDISAQSNLPAVNISSSNFGPFTANTGFCSICGEFSNMSIVGNTFINGLGASSLDGVNVTSGDNIVVSGNNFGGVWTTAVNMVTGGAVTNANVQANSYGSSVSIKTLPPSSSGSISIGVATP